MVEQGRCSITSQPPQNDNLKLKDKSSDVALEGTSRSELSRSGCKNDFMSDAVLRRG